MNQFGAWGGGSGTWAGSPEQALQRFNGGTITPGMVEGYYRQQWSGQYYNIEAGYASKGNGFYISATLTPANDANIAVAYTSYEKMAQLMGMNGQQQIGGSVLDQTNWLLSVGSLGLQNTPGSFRLGTSKLGFSPKYYGNAWPGNQYAKTFKIGNIGTAVSRGLVGLGIAADTYRWYNGDISGGKFGLNTGMGLYGLTGVGTIPSLLYFGMEAFYPGGWERAMEVLDRNKRANEEILGPSWRTIPFNKL